MSSHQKTLADFIIFGRTSKYFKEQKQVRRDDNHNPEPPKELIPNQNSTRAM
jgi:hypothetical protein